MTDLHLNPLAILAAAGSAFVLGAIWYSPALFYRPWLEGSGLTDAEAQAGSPARIFGLAFLLTVAMAFNLAAFLAGPPDVVWGVTAGVLAGFGWASLSLGVIYLFERRPLKHFVVNAGYLTTAFAVMGAILGLWK